VGAQSYYYLFDGQGSVIGLVNASGAKVNSYSYDPYGGARSATEQVANPNRYDGGYLDTYSGLYHFGARYYDPILGRFTNSTHPVKIPGMSTLATTLLTLSIKLVLAGAHKIFGIVV
jgi:RHS repeat-associated protein